MNITLNVDAHIVKKVRKIAIDRDTTLAAMVRDFLKSVAETDTTAKQEHIARFKETSERLSREMGPRTWTRDDLYERPARSH